MTLSFDGTPEITHRRCHECGGEHDSVNGFLLRDGSAYAVYFAAWYPHKSEAWIDVAIGSWEPPDYADHVTFGCRIGYVESQSESASSLVHGGQVLSDSPMFGQKLNRDEALAHPWLNSFWEVVDWLILNDPTLHEHVFHMPPRPNPAL
jgi:hypothetical protein